MLFLVPIDLGGKGIECLCDKACFGSADCLEPFKSRLVKSRVREGKRNAVDVFDGVDGGCCVRFLGYRRNVALEALVIKMLQKPFDNLGIRSVIEDKVAFAVDRKVVDFVGEGRRSAVLDVFFKLGGDGLYKLLALAAGYIEFDCH